jgi:hypothetical protein
MVVQQAKLDADLCTSSSLVRPSIQAVHDYYPSALEDVGRLAAMAVDRDVRLVILVVDRRFPSMGAAGSRSSRSESYARMKELVRQSKYVPFHRFHGLVRREFMQRLPVGFHGTLGSNFRDTLQEGGATVIARLPSPRAQVSVSIFSSSLLVDPTTFLAINA